MIIKTRNGPLVEFDEDDPQPTAICDRTGFLCLHKDLVRQLEYQGDNLVWTGLLVHKDFVLQPNPSLKNPPVYSDPSPVELPRPKTMLEETTPLRPQLTFEQQLYELQNNVFNHQDLEKVAP